MVLPLVILRRAPREVSAHFNCMHCFAAHLMARDHLWANAL